MPSWMPRPRPTVFAAPSLPVGRPAATAGTEPALALKAQAWRYGPLPATSTPLISGGGVSK